MPFNPFQELEIEKNAPLPPGLVAPRIPFEKMEVGDSVVVPHAEWGIPGKQAVKYASLANKRHAPKRFAAKRNEADTHTRIWRVADDMESTSDESPQH